MNGRFLLFFIISFVVPRLQADEIPPPIVWGEVPIGQLQMKSYPTDSNASALVLCDYGEVHFDNSYNLVYTRHRRIKILTRAGFDWAGTHSVSYYTEERTQRLNDLEGMTISLSADGKIIKQELDDNAIFTEEVNKSWERVRFTLPSLSEGCVVEYRYTLKSESPLYMPEWDFQTSEPTVWSEFRVQAPYVFGYAVLTQGYQRFFVKQSEVTKQPFTSPRGTEIINVASSRWVMRDIPAIREEPYMTTVEDYLSKVSFQLSIINWPGYASKKVLETWDKVVNELDDSRNFGKQLSGYSAVRRQVEMITDGITAPVEKAVAIYDFLRNTLVWNNRYRIFTDEDLDEVLEKKTGSSAEINLLLILMLREAGFKANPVILSTRSHGKVYTAYPMVDQFNYVIAQLAIGKETHLLDATDRFRPFSLLPLRALNQSGLSVDGEGYSWIPIQPKGKWHRTTTIVASLSADGLLTAKVDQSYSDYGAIDERKSLVEDKDIDYVKRILDAEATGMSVDSFTISNKETCDKPLVISANVSSNGLVQVLDDFIYVTPRFVGRMKSNPFKLENRTFPVDYAYPHRTDYILTLAFPEGYIMNETPRELSIGVPKGAGKYLRRVSLEKNVFQMRLQFEINKTLIDPILYTNLREFYDRIVALEAEQLVFQKQSTTSGR